MQVLSVWVPKDPPAHGDAFGQLAARFVRQADTGPFTIQWEEETCGDHRVFRFHSGSPAQHPSQAGEMVRNFVALVIVEWIVRVLEPELIRDRVLRERAQNDADRWEEVVPYVQRALKPENHWHPCPRRAAMYRKVLASLQENGELHLHGLIRFRLKQERQDLYEAVSQGWQAYLEEQEHQMFLELLHHLVSEQEAMCEVMHVVHPSPRSALLRDGQGEAVRLDVLDALLRREGRNLREEEYLLSALIWLAPEQVVLHARNGMPEWGGVLARVYGKRLTICPACVRDGEGCPLDAVSPAPYNT